MNNNEILNYLETMINYSDNINSAQKYIKENFGVSSDYDNDTNTIYIYTTNINESLNVVAAKEYLYEKFTPEIINVVYGKKDIN